MTARRSQPDDPTLYRPACGDPTQPVKHIWNKFELRKYDERAALSLTQFWIKVFYVE